MNLPAFRAAVGAGELIVDVLGCGSGRPTAARDTSSLLIGAAGEWTLVDCPGSVVHKLALRGLVPEDIARVILTHDHVDHVYGLPHLLHALAIGARAQRLEVAAPAETLATVAAMVRVHGLDRDHYPRLERREIAAVEGTRVAAADGFAIRCSPAAHGRPTVSVRFDVGDFSVCYSSDTRACAATAALARGANLLLHDCGGPERRAAEFDTQHASAADAGRIAAQAGVDRLVLMHLGMDDSVEEQECLSEARAGFDGQVDLARDGERWRWGKGA